MSTNLNTIKSILFSETNQKNVGTENKESKETKETSELKSNFFKVTGVTLHNDDDDGTFSNIIESAEMTITDNNNQTLFSGKMVKEEREGYYVTNFKVQFSTVTFFNSKECIDEHVQSCIKKGLIEAAALPIKIKVKAHTYDGWSDNISNGSKFDKTLTVEKLSSDNIENGCIQISFRTFNLKSTKPISSKLGM